MKRAVEQKIPISVDDIHNIFGNIDRILDLHLEFLLRIETAKADDSVWSETLYSLHERFEECYLPYIGNHKRTLEIAARSYHLLRLIEHIPPELKKMTESLGNFTASLAKPVVQFFGYISLLKTLRDTTHPTEPRFTLVKQALQAMQSIAKLVDEAIFRAECRDAVEKLKETVEDWKGHKIESFGNLLLFGDFNITKPTSSNSHPAYKYGIYLFERIILVCKYVRRPANRKLRRRISAVQKTTSVQLKGRIFVQNITDVVLLGKDIGQYSVQIFFRGDPGIQQFSIKFPNEKTARDWQTAISSQDSVMKAWAESRPAKEEPEQVSKSPQKADSTSSSAALRPPDKTWI
jgi:cell division control protein 24